MNSNSPNSSCTIDIPAVKTKHASSESRAKREGRCQHLFPNGKRCNKFAPASRLGLCRDHYDASAAIGASLQQEQSDFTDLSAELLPEHPEFAAGTDIRQFLARLLAKGRISPRRASVLAFISSQLLHSLRAITLEAKPAEDEQRIIIDMPGPNRDWSEPEPRPDTTYEDLRS